MCYISCQYNVFNSRFTCLFTKAQSTLDVCYAVKKLIVLTTDNNKVGYALIVTARKRSLGQGNIFTSVCHSVKGGGWWLPSMHHRSHDQGGSTSGGLHRGGLHPGGGLPPGRVCRGVGRPSPEIYGILRDTVNKRAVCILLECILVKICLHVTFLNACSLSPPLLNVFILLSSE